MKMSAVKKKALRKYLEDLERDGRITPQRLIDQARGDKKHPAYKDLFGKSDGVLANERRLDIARALITSVRITYVGDRGQQVSGVGYLRDPATPSNEQGYVSVVRLRTERENAYEALVAAMEKAQAALERVKELAALLELEEEFEAMMQSVTGFSSRMRRGRTLGGEEARVN